MARIEVVLCDVCGQKKPEHPGHWSYAFGSVTLDFKDMAGLQQITKYQDCCLPCAQALSDACSKTADLLKEKAAAKTATNLANKLIKEGK